MNRRHKRRNGRNRRRNSTGCEEGGEGGDSRGGGRDGGDGEGGGRQSGYFVATLDRREVRVKLGNSQRQRQQHQQQRRAKSTDVEAKAAARAARRVWSCCWREMLERQHPTEAITKEEETGAGGSNGTVQIFGSESEPSESSSEESEGRGGIVNAESKSIGE